MKIIKAGRPKGDRRIRLTCPHCDTVFEAALTELQFVGDQREGDYYHIHCPLAACGSFFNLSAEIAQQRAKHQ